jgi:hypothetical protein
MPDSFPHPDPATIRAAILASSPITRLGLTCPNETLQERSADELAREIVERLKADHSQFKLAL